MVKHRQHNLIRIVLLLVGFVGCSMEDIPSPLKPFENETIKVDVLNRSGVIQVVNNTEVIVWANSPLVELQIRNKTNQPISFDIEIANIINFNTLNQDDFTFERGQYVDQHHKRWPVELAANTTHSFRQTSSQTATTDWSFVSIGDLGAGFTHMQDMFEEIGIQELDFVIAIGDPAPNYSADALTQLHRGIKGLNKPIYFVPPQLTSDQLLEYETQLGNAETCFTYRGVQFVVGQQCADDDKVARLVSISATARETTAKTAELHLSNLASDSHSNTTIFNNGANDSNVPHYFYLHTVTSTAIQSERIDVP